MYRHGEILISKAAKVCGDQLNHLVLAEGEVTNHKHEIVNGDAKLYEQDGVMYLSIKSDTADLVHPDHKTIELPKGDYKIEIQREYVVGDEKYRSVAD
jgi:hypothetical protein